MTTRIARRTELAHRASDGIDVYLYWNEPTSRVPIGVLDAGTNQSFELEVDGRCALDAFNHPYAYAALTERAGLEALSEGLDVWRDSEQTTINPWRTDHASTDR